MLEQLLYNSQKLVRRVEQAWRIKEEVDRITQALRLSRFHQSFEGLLALAAQYNTGVYVAENCCITAYAHRPRDKTKPKTIVLPLMEDEVTHSNLAHELGHVILDTGNETTVIYFTARLLYPDHMITGLALDHARAARAGIRKQRKMFELYQDWGRDDLLDYVEVELENLEEQGVPPQLLGLIRADFEKLYVANFEKYAQRNQ